MSVFAKMSFILLVLSFAGCATEAPEPDPVSGSISASSAEEKPPPRLSRVYMPLQTMYIIQKPKDGDSFDRNFIALHFDRRDGYSVLPGRLIFEPGKANTVTPVEILGKAGLERGDIIVMRNSLSRYALREPEPGSGTFVYKNAETFAAPEFIIYASFVNKPVVITSDELKNKKKGLRNGLEDLKTEAAGKMENTLTVEVAEIIDRFFAQSRVFCDYEGIHSAAIFPFKPISLPGYDDSLSIVISPGRSFNPGRWETYGEITFEAVSRTAKGNPFPDITLGDMGVFSGGTVLLEPDLFRHTRNLVSMNNIVRMPGPARSAASPVTIQGSFNIYRDERNRYLWYPGIISYIPGFHPDISGGDIEILFDASREELDSVLETEKNLYFGTKELAGGLPVFFLAAPSARELELGYERNESVRSMLSDFLNRPAYNVRLFE